MGDPLGHPPRRRGLRHTGDRRREDLPADQVHLVRVRGAFTLSAPPTAERPYFPAAGHDAWLWLYDPLTRLFGADKIFRSFLDQAALQPDSAVLDVGCGTGTLAVLLKRLHPTIDVTGLDPDPKALARARRKAGRAGVAVRFDRGFGDELPYGDGAFDRVFSSMMFHHVPRVEKPKVLAEIHRVLKPGGSLEFLDMAPAGEDRMLGRLHEAGFVDARKVAERKLVFGRIAFHRGTRPSFRCHISLEQQGGAT